MASHEAGLAHAVNRLCGAVILPMIVPVMLLACGPGVGPDREAGADASDGDDTGVAIAPPSIPWLAEGAPPIAPPVLTPCPEGWHEVIQGVSEDPDGERDVVTCDPYGTEPGGTEPDTCPTGQAHFPGDPGCTSVGTPCPSGDFPEGLPSDRTVLYVLASAGPGGDGSEASPVSTITEGLALASRGTILAIGKGEYDEALRLPPGVTLWGACAAQTRLTASSWGLLAQGVITVPGADGRVANLWVGPAELPGIAVYGDGASLSLDGVVIDGARTHGLWVVRRARVDGRELVVSGTRGDEAGSFGIGIGVQVGGTLDLRRASISDNRNGGVLAHDEGTSLTLADVVVRDTQGQESDGTGGRGLNIQGGAAVTVTRALLSRNRDIGVFAKDEGTSLTLLDVVIRDTRSQRSDRTAGRGLNVQEGAAATVTRTLLSRNGDLGAYASNDGTSLTLADVVIHDTQAQESDGTAGRGLNVEQGATVTVARTLLSQNREIAVYASDDGTSLTLSDVVIRGTQAQQSDGTGGRGLGIQRGAAATITHTLLSRNRDISVLADGEGTSLTLSDVVVRDTQAQQSDGTGGQGLGVQRGATATVTRALFSRNRQVGVLAGSLGTIVELVDVVVAETNEQACADTTCADRPYGVGILGSKESKLSATRFAVQDGALCGVMLAEEAEVDLAIGEVSGFQIGVCLQVSGYSVPRLTDRVRYVDNGNNLDATSLPLPDLARPFDAAR